MEIHAIAIDRKDQVFAATSPDGKVYRVQPDGKFAVFYDPKAKYIWAMVFDSAGRLYVATGDQGEIHRVSPDGAGAVFFKTEETHARSLAMDAKDNLIVGTEPGGVILRVSPGGDGFVLYQAGKREITSVAVAKDGAIYAAGVGNKTPGIAPMIPTAPVPSPAPTAAGAMQPTVRQVPAGPPPPSMAAPAPSIVGGSEVYRIEPDGSPHKVWSDASDLAYAIGFDGEGRPLVGTGNKGNIYRLDSEVLSTLLASVTPTQVTGFGAGRNGSVYAVTGNVGKVFQIGPGTEKDGYYESEALDAAFFSYWGRLTIHRELHGGSIGVETRSGNLDRPQKNWSPWATAATGESGRVPSPAARFLQYKATVRAAANGRSPEISGFEIAYLPKNVAPVIEQIESTPANYKFAAPSSLTLTSSSSSSITLPPLGRKKNSSGPILAISTDSSSVSMTSAKGWVGARWLAKDDNGDTLLYKVEIRGEKEREWKLLKDKVKEKYYAWDSTAFPDGDYRVRVTASDEPSNPPGQALENSMESDVFVIDNTPPAITGLTGELRGGKLTAKWHAKDALNIIAKAEYSLDGGEWLMVEPVTRLSDSQDLDYSLTVEKLAGGEHTLAVRVTDDYDNQAVEKVVVR